ncbi:MAG: Methylmalonyl-CoA mutase [Bacteroidota bacterium]|jgi:methylmalonyl-CoA mutase
MKNLFNDFDNVSSKQWKQQLQFELKGKDYNETLVWHSPEDIKVKPFYHADENIENAAINTKCGDFKICQNIFVFDVQKSIERTNDAISRGATTIRFSIESPRIDIERLLLETTLENISVYFNLGFIEKNFINKISEIATSNNLNVQLNLDPIGYFVKNGNWQKTDKSNVFETLKNIESKNMGLAINMGLYQNAGANIVQELAFAMAHATEYFENFTNLQNQFVFEVAIGGNYFFDIAKLRALRVLFKTIAAAYNHNLECQILATPTKRNKTIYDYNTNLIRTTSECMSAVLGGANVIANLPYDSLYHKDNEFGDRIARNQLLILQNEAYFDKVNNPSDGSYYIESLTNQLAEKALTLFKEIEAAGGCLKSLHDGKIQQKIAESRTKEQQLFDENKLIIVGTNKFLNVDDRMKNDLEIYPFLKNGDTKTVIQPIFEQRLAEKNEQRRLIAEDKLL